MNKNDFYEEPVTISNIEDYKELLDSIRYICDFNGYDKNFDYREDVLEPELPENGKPENNFITGFKSKTSNEAYVYSTYYQGFNSDDVVFLGSFYENSKFHGQGIGRIVYEKLEEKWKLAGMKKVILNVDLKNTKAILFWIKMGFKTIDNSFVCNENENEKFYMLRLSKNI